MSGVYSKVNGKFNISQINSKYNNNWRDTYQIYKKDDSSWEKVYNYWYEYSDWSDCSVSCGGGTQTRTATCRRSDGIIKSNDYCRKYGLTTDILIRQCNTHPCVYYVTGRYHYDDHGSLSFLSRITGQRTFLVNPSDVGGDGSRVWGRNFEYDEFPIRFILNGCNWSRGSHLCTNYVNVNGQGNNLLYPNPCYREGGNHHVVLYYEVTLNNVIQNKFGWDNCGGWAVNRTKFTYSDYDPWTNTYHAFGVNC